MNYYQHSYNLRSEKTGRAFSTRPVNLTRVDRLGGMTLDEDLWARCEHLCTVSHARVMSLPMERKRRMMDRRLYEAGMTGRVK
jgi:hypothetical protein